MDSAPQAAKFVVSGSTGEVSIHEVGGDSIHEVLRWKAHDLEVWIAAVSISSPSIVYSGSNMNAYLHMSV